MKDFALNLTSRPRRNRSSEGMRSLVQETQLSPRDFVLPLFFHEEEDDVAIASMPGVTRWSLGGLVQEAGAALALGIPAVVLFPKIDESQKTKPARRAFIPKGWSRVPFRPSNRPIPS